MCVIHRILRLCATTALLAEVSMMIKNFFCTYYVLHSNSILLLIASVVSNSVRPHRRHPTRLPRLWDSPDKNTGVGCISFSNTMHTCQVTSVTSNSVQPHGQQPTRLLCPRDSLGKNTGVGCHFLLHLRIYYSLHIIVGKYIHILRHV